MDQRHPSPAADRRRPVARTVPAVHPALRGPGADGGRVVVPVDTPVDGPVAVSLGCRCR